MKKPNEDKSEHKIQHFRSNLTCSEVKLSEQGSRRPDVFQNSRTHGRGDSSIFWEMGSNITYLPLIHLYCFYYFSSPHPTQIPNRRTVGHKTNERPFFFSVHINSSCIYTLGFRCAAFLFFFMTTRKKKYSE